MSFLTDFTPLMPCAVATAVLALSCELTNPLSCTVPLNVSTLISADLRLGCSKIAVLTLAVTTLSSTYSPVPSDLAVEAHPMAVAVARMARKVERVWIFFMVFSCWGPMMGRDRGAVCALPYAGALARTMAHGPISAARA